MITEILLKLMRVLFHVFYIFPIKKNQIIFNSQKGRQFACNPRTIFEDIYKHHQNQFKFIWCIQNPPQELLRYSNITFVSYNTLAYFFYQLTSKIIVSNIPSPSYVPLRKKQFMIDTWHGGGAYKKVGISCPKKETLSEISTSNILLKQSVEAKNNTQWEFTKAKYNAKDTSIFLSSCKKFTEVMYASQLLPIEAYLECGMPRNDIFFKDYTHIISKVKLKLGIDLSTKVVLFAPTYRGSVKNQRFNLELNIEKCINALSQKFGGNWVFVFRIHVLAKDTIPVNSQIIDASNYQDMQELLCMTDVFITDYSSSMWDFALTKKPAFLFTPDLEYYLNEDRGFYTPINDWAFPYAQTNQELIELIINFNEEKHIQKVKNHLELLGSFDEGTATQTIRNIILRQIE